MPSAPSIPQVRLNNGVTIPQVGYGVFLVPPEETQEAVATALDVGYRHIDTAAAYGNEEAVGRALRESGLGRDEVFVTTKCWNSDHGYEPAIAACQASLERLDLEYLDLYLIHWPVPELDAYVDTWRALQDLYADDKAHAIGVSNFQVPHLQRLLAETETVPAVNQIELHPWLPQRELRAFHAEHDIVTEAWSPIARGGDLLSDPAVTAIADRLHVSPAQVVLRWHLDLGNVVIPKSVHRERMQTNLDLFGVELTDEDRTAIDALDRGRRVGPDPDEFNTT